jgi:hypothetical protein
MFARTVYVDNESRDPVNGIQYDGQQKPRSDGGVFSLQSDDTMPMPWKQTPSVKSGSTSNDKDKGSVPYRPTTAGVPESSELPAKPASLYQTSESIEEDERGSEYAPQDPTEPPPSNIPPARAGRLVIQLNAAERVV